MIQTKEEMFLAEMGIHTKTIIEGDYTAKYKLTDLLKNYAEQCNIADVVGRSEQLKAEVFTLANKLAISGEGDAAVAMHRIHNRL
jgi:hypothetical protein